MVLNAAFFPALMWNARFSAPSGDPFDNSLGFQFPNPEGHVKFPPYDHQIRTLLAAQGHIPSTELPEMAGFNGANNTSQLLSRFGGLQFRIDANRITRTLESPNVTFTRQLNAKNSFATSVGDVLPPPDSNGSRNEPIRLSVLKRVQAIAEYRRLFGLAFPAYEQGLPINFGMIANALAEFQTSLTFANAPIDKYARGDWKAMTDQQKRGALTFLTTGKCWQCHTAKGRSNEMFSDFQNHVIAVPQVVPTNGNVQFAGPNRDQDVGLQDITSSEEDAYKFRTSPLRNLALKPFFMHNGAFSTLEAAILHHLDAKTSVAKYSPQAAGLPSDLKAVDTSLALSKLSPLLATPIALSKGELADLVAFVRDGLQDPRATRAELCKLVPTALPSKLPMQKFEGC